MDIDKAWPPVLKRTWQGADNIKTLLLPEMNSRFIG
jgi:hypothetical protein